MTSFPSSLSSIRLIDHCIEIYVPDETAIQNIYQNQKNAAYWAKIWPASIALCRFLELNPHFISNQYVLELAAGLGLPGLYAAAFAKQITITDKEPLAEEFVRRSAAHLGLKNIIAKTLNWNDAIHEPLPDIVLLSDVNYEPHSFPTLKNIISHFINNNTTVIISTPQPLMAKTFMSDLLAYCIMQWNDTVKFNENENEISVFVLNKNLKPL